MKKLSTDPYKGVRDFYPEDQAVLMHFFTVCRQVLEKYGYVEYGASILEPAELYRAKGAENEEIASEQTYTFTDRGKREVTLRPEMTPTVARMVAAKRREMGYPLRLYSLPNVFRYERPQKGRLREHWQLNVDIFGSHSLYADAEILSIAYGLMKAFGARDEDFVIRISDRRLLSNVLARTGLDDSARRRFIAVLDRKNKSPADARRFEEMLREYGITDWDSAMAPLGEHELLLKEFAMAGIKNMLWDPSVVRGFNYYTGLVFEVYDTSNKNSRSLFGGGRYDNLTQLFDSEPLPGVGFGMGDVTLRDFLDTHGLLPTYRSPTDLYIAITGGAFALAAQTFAGELREQGISVAIDFGERKLADQIRTAAKHQIPYLIVLGENELASGHVKLRTLANGEERELEKGAIAAALRKA